MTRSGSGFVEWTELELVSWGYPGCPGGARIHLDHARSHGEVVSPRAHRLPYLLYSHLLVEENEIDRETHEIGVDASRRAKHHPVAAGERIAKHQTLERGPGPARFNHLTGDDRLR